MKIMAALGTTSVVEMTNVDSEKHFTSTQKKVKKLATTSQMNMNVEYAERQIMKR